MIRRVQALNYRCFRHLDIALDRFHLLIGPNGGGKRTLIDTVQFLGDMVRDGPEAAVNARAGDFRDLVWGRPERDLRFEIAVEFVIPERCMTLLPTDRDFGTYRYEIAMGCDGDDIRIEAERGVLMPAPGPPPAQETLFPYPLEPPSTILSSARAGVSTALSKASGNDWFYAETTGGKGWTKIGINFGPRRSTLGSLPESVDTMPVTTGFKDFLERRVRRLTLDGDALGGHCAADAPTDAPAADGSNLPALVRRMRHDHRERFEEWLKGVQASIPELVDIRVSEREPDRAEYLVLVYDDGRESPAWLESEGTLKLLALTLLPALPPLEGLYWVVEPERSLHPSALGAVHAALSGVPGAQVLASTHSRTLIDQVRPQHVLSLDRNPAGEARVVRGSEPPPTG
ncbi:MAG: AAA family ATPase [Gemmatimonadetes bacterium]|nr:AAA family ATPase [Gemmatimonadota bacterium]MYA41807.1 AAA family ATPase [Gemmatimonadota bacterium]MYE91797.1 AAA family ATPase [Gemmatimonadota bacterium]MYJ10227.1 AAA family ATPase [Gemmatimonadota bacterium]